MTYLSAQPDEFYFAWQLELQLHNFSRMGIPKEQIHVLVCYKELKGVSLEFLELQENFKSVASFYFYEDTRKSKHYTPSLRPHIISKHFKNNPDLNKGTVFYHDSDILFTRYPEFESLCHDNNWYLSDTQDYLDSKYVIERTNIAFFERMCNLIDIDPKIVIQNDVNCGGAQYLLKNVDWCFWEKVEEHSERLYILIKENNIKAFEDAKKNGLNSPNAIQPWCADMWVMFWLGLRENHPIKIHKKLDFALAKDSITDLLKKDILHYSGDDNGVEGPIFQKTKYRYISPFYESEIKNINKNSAGYFVIEEIKNYKKKLDDIRVNLIDVSFIFCVKIDSTSRSENLYATVSYINKNFSTNILIAECDSDRKIDRELLPERTEYFFLQSNEEILYRTQINNFLIHNSRTKHVVMIDTDVVIPINQLLKAIDLIKAGEADVVSPYDGRFVMVDQFFKPIFCKLLDDRFLCMNISHFTISSKRSVGGVIIFNKEAYMQCGFENENFTSWGPEDIERVKRCQNYGLKYQRIEGPLFHLCHDRKINSGYHSDEQYCDFMDEFFRISNMNHEKISDYKKNWTNYLNLKYEITN